MIDEAWVLMREAVMRLLPKRAKPAGNSAKQFFRRHGNSALILTT